MYSIAELKTDLEGRLHGTSLNKVQNINGLINQTAKTIVSDIDAAETKRTVQITNAIYDQVFDYQLPSDVKGIKIVDVKPQSNRNISDNFSQRYSEQFDMYKTDNTLNIVYNNSVKSLRISKSLQAGVTLNQMNGITDNGTWAVGGDAENLRQDTLTKISGNASLRFDLSGVTGAAYIENSTMDAQDLTDKENIGAIFTWVYIPQSVITNGVTSVNLRWGSSSSDYWAQTVTETQEGTAFITGWNLVRLDWEGATETGTPDVTDITYTRVTLNYTLGAALTDIRVDNIVARLGTIFDIEYYSKYLFRDSVTNAFAEKVASDDDLINLDTDSYNLFLDKLSQLAARQIQGEDSAFDWQTMQLDYEKGIKKYKSSNKSEFMKPQSTYYRIKGRQNSRGLNNVNRS